MTTKAKQRAAKNNLTFTLTADWVEERIKKGTCELTGLPFSMDESGFAGPYSPSIDRIIPKKGYTPKNCRVILYALNASFGAWGEDVFASIAIAYLRRRVEGAK